MQLLPKHMAITKKARRATRDCRLQGCRPCTGTWSTFSNEQSWNVHHLMSSGLLYILSWNVNLGVPIHILFKQLYCTNLFSIIQNQSLKKGTMIFKQHL